VALEVNGGRLRAAARRSKADAHGAGAGVSGGGLSRVVSRATSVRLCPPGAQPAPCPDLFHVQHRAAPRPVSPRTRDPPCSTRARPVSRATSGRPCSAPCPDLFHVQHRAASRPVSPLTRDPPCSSRAPTCFTCNICPEPGLAPRPVSRATSGRAAPGPAPTRRSRSLHRAADIRRKGGRSLHERGSWKRSASRPAAPASP
jgi:hypothetical protein